MSTAVVTSVRLASVGLGWWGDELARAAQRSKWCEIVTCFARSEDTRRAFAERHGCRAAPSFAALLADPEVEGVLLATPHSTHRWMVEEAASAGKHVFVEKPLTLTVEDGVACLAAVERAGVTLMVGHHRRRQAANRRLKALIDEGRLGLVHQVEATFTVPIYQTPKPGWRSDPKEVPVGGMTGLGVHMVDTFHYLIGPTARVFALSKRLLGRGAIDDATVVALEFAAGPLGYLGTSLVLPRVCTVAALGTQGCAWSEREGSRLFVQAKDADDRSPEPIAPNDPLAEELAEFAVCIREGRQPETGGAEALAVVAVLEAIVASAARGQPIEVAPVIPAP